MGQGIGEGSVGRELGSKNNHYKADSVLVVNDVHKSSRGRGS